MGKKLVSSTVLVPTAKGEKRHYTFRVFDDTTGQIVESASTTDKKEAQKHYESFKNKYPDVAAAEGAKAALNPWDDDAPETPAGNYSTSPPVSSPPQTEAATDIRDYSSPHCEPTSANSPIKTSKLNKKARDLSGMAKHRREKYEKLSETQKAEKKVSGVFNTKRAQAMVRREDADSEVVVGRGADNNAFIIIGNDRANKLHTGYGGKGHTQCDAIDLVVGMGGHTPKEVDSSENELVTNPNFFLDSARIYISQKTDVDKNFGIGEFGRAEDDKQDEKDDKEIGKYGAKSAIAAKADNIRLIGRESIMIVTGTDAENSQGGDVLAKSGIEIVAMNNTKTLQPMVLGDNLQKLLSVIIDNIAALAKITDAYTKYQMKLNQAATNHYHHSPFFGIPTTQSTTLLPAGIQTDIETTVKTQLSVLKHLTNLASIKANYLSEAGDNYINSRLNKVN